MDILTEIKRGFYSEMTGVRKFFTGLVQSRIEDMQEITSHVVRVIFVNLLVLGVCMLVILSGLILIPFSLLMFSDWSIPAKMLVGTLIGLAYIGLGIGISYWLMEKKRWKDIFKIDRSQQHGRRY